MRTRCHQATERSEYSETQNELIPVGGCSVLPSLPVDKLNPKVRISFLYGVHKARLLSNGHVNA